MLNTLYTTTLLCLYLLARASQGIHLSFHQLSCILALRYWFVLGTWSFLRIHEHVGWHESPRDDTKIPKALENLKSLVKPGGKIIITVPIGQNPVLDDLVRKRSIEFDRQYYMKRVSKSNLWIETSEEEAYCLKYGSPYRDGNAIMIAFISRA